MKQKLSCERFRIAICEAKETTSKTGSLQYYLIDNVEAYIGHLWRYRMGVLILTNCYQVPGTRGFAMVQLGAVFVRLES